MDHLSAEQLAELAVAGDLTSTLTEPEADHLATCAVCGAELQSLNRIIELAGSSVPPRPPAGVWERVRTAIEDNPDGVGAAGQLESNPPRSQRAEGRSRWRWLVAAAVGFLVGGVSVGGMVVAVHRSARPAAPQAIAQVDLRSLPGETGQGSAALVRSDGVIMLVVTATVAATPRAFHEVWLLNDDGQRMVAMGVLPSSGRAAFVLPPTLDDQLHGYRTVDVSAEPDDGDARHSGHSILRGQLPS